MVAVAHLVRFYVDESAAGLGLALAAARKDCAFVGTSVDSQARVRIAQDAMSHLEPSVVKWLSLDGVGL
jgi:hypothetical protein